MSALNRKLKSILSQPKPKSMIAAELESLVRDRERAAAEKAWYEGLGMFERAWERDHLNPYDYATDNPYRRGGTE